MRARRSRFMSFWICRDMFWSSPKIRSQQAMLFGRIRWKARQQSPIRPPAVYLSSCRILVSPFKPFTCALASECTHTLIYNTFAWLVLCLNYTYITGQHVCSWSVSVSVMLPNFQNKYPNSAWLITSILPECFIFSAMFNTSDCSLIFFNCRPVAFSFHQALRPHLWSSILRQHS